VELYLHSPNTFSWRGAQLKHRDNFSFTFTLPELEDERIFPLNEWEEKLEESVEG
jgi:hypothetical protein